jgi:hypothetical protein
MCEEYLNDVRKIYPPELQRVAAHAMMLKAKGAKAELKLAVDEAWKPIAYDAENVYLRAIIDVVMLEGDHLHIQDWKTGRIYDSHKDQLSTYVAVAAANYPDAKDITVRAIYIDQGMVSTPTSTHAERGLKPIRLMLDGRIKNAESDEIYPTRAGKHCSYCDYSKRWEGPCQF